MNILVTAGSTSVPIDRVRVISNVFRGRTGHLIAHVATARGHHVTLLTSAAPDASVSMDPCLRVRQYRSFDDLRALMEEEIRDGAYDAIIHSAAVSDYRVGAVRASSDHAPPLATDAKISSSYGRLILELVPTEKLIDLIREPWGFKGTLVKFKLQVGITDEELLAIARESVKASRADFIVANCLEWARERAYIVDANGTSTSVIRDRLAEELLARIS